MVGGALDHPGRSAVKDGGWRSSASRVLKRLLRVDDGALMRWRPGAVRFGSLRRLTPISTTFGFDRGLPIDRVLH